MKRACVARVLYGIPFTTKLARRFCRNVNWMALAELNAAANPPGPPIGASLSIPLSPIPALPARGKVIRTVGDVDLQEQADAGELHECDTGLAPSDLRDSLPAWPSLSSLHT